MDPQANPSPGTETPKESSNGANQRRSTRLLVAVPVILSGKDARGEKFREETRTTFINRQGATVSVSHIITPGTELQIENPPLGIIVRARAIRFIQKSAPGDLHQVAVELIDLKNVWGIQYPPQDWQKSIPTPAKPEKEKASPAPKTIEIDLTSSLSPAPAHLRPASPPLPALSASIPAGNPLEAAQDIASPGNVEISETTLVKMTRSAAEIDDRLQSSLQDALAQLEAKRNDAEQMLLQSIKSATPALVSEMQQQAAQVTSTSLQEFQQNYRASLTTLADEVFSSNSQRLGEQQTQVTQEAIRQIELASQSTLERFASELREAAQNAHASELSGLQEELIARSVAETESRRAKALEAMETQTREATHANLEAFRQELQQQTKAFRESILPEIAREAVAQSVTGFESVRAAFDAQAKQEIQLAARAELENFRAELQCASNQAREDTVSSAAQSAAEAESRHAKALEAMEAQTREATRASLEAFRQELQQQTNSLHESILPEIAREAVAQSATGFESARAALNAQAKQEIQLAARAELENFRAELQRASSQALEESVSSATRSAEEIESRHAKALEAMEAQTREATRASLEAFRQELQQQAKVFRESILPEIAREAAAQSATGFESARAAFNVQAKQEIQLAARAELENFCAELQRASSQAREESVSSAARSAEEIESRHTKALEAMQAQTSEATRVSLEGFRQELQQQAKAFRESILPEITREAAAQSVTGFESARAALNAQAKQEIQLAARAELENFRAELQRASSQVREETVSSAVRSAEDLQARQSGAIKEAEKKIHCAFEAHLEGFQDELENRARQFQQRTVTLVEQPAQEITKYATDTLLRAREEADLLRKTFIEGTHAQLGAITRGTLASMTDESKALTEEYRNQLRAAFESIKEKSAVEIKSDIRNALEEGRESALRQLQKDAEDFSAVAVGQFRGKSAEAVREASDAVNKQVGAAAFVVKEWLDQATQRLESYLGRMEKQSEAATEAIQNRSHDLSQITLERFRKESETLLLSLRQRIQNASDALAGPLPEPDRPESEISSLSAFEDHSTRALK